MNKPIISSGLGAALAALCVLPAWGQTTPAVQITSLDRSPAGLSLAWTNSAPGFAFEVQSRDSLSQGQWMPAPSDTPWPVTVYRWTDARPASSGMRFYRVLATPGVQRGRILSTKSLLTYSTLEITVALWTQGLRDVVPQYGVEVRKIIYETVDPHGGRTQASGTLVLPQGATPALPLVSYQHGTLVKKTDAPSSGSNLEELFIGVVFAATGYAAVLPDYLGLGDSPGLHPYHHAKSEATASVDMLRAARSFCATNGPALNGKLFLVGYSQGGHATMALHRELEALHANEFTITASAPMAGAYDLSGATTDDFLSGRNLPNPYYFVYLLAAYQDVYHYADSLAAVLTPPYDSTLPPLLTGQNSGGEINAKMSHVVTEVMKPEVLAAFKADLNHPLRAALRENDLYLWTPRAPMHLYHCAGDGDVVFKNSQVARDSFLSRGANQVQLIDPVPAADHSGCVLPSLLDAKSWFDSLR